MAELQKMLKSHPNPGEMHGEALAACLEACLQCLQACTSCADACVAEEKVANLRRCIRTDLDCADICEATASALSRQTEPTPELIRRQVESLSVACNVCAEECEKHASMHEHCQICAEACRRCEQSCEKLLQTMPVTA